MNRLGSQRVWMLALVLPLLAACDAPPRPVDADPSSGFALYRSGLLSHAEIREICALGVEEILVLDGEAEEQECRLRSEQCPGLRVRYNLAQEEDSAVTADFLRAFDAWIEEARAEGRKVAFRCRHGWHRTGRLAAYYRMRFGGASAEDAAGEMHEIGRMMWRHPTLDPQIEAYADFIAGRACSTAPAHCVSSAPDPGAPAGGFPADACGSGGGPGAAAGEKEGIAGWLVAHQKELGLVSAAAFVLALIALPVVVGKLPEDYFVRERREPMRQEGSHPLAWGVLSLVKNLVGIAFILAGVAMLVLPGQGTLTILLGLGLTNFPGKYKLEQRILSQPAVRGGLDKIREKAGKPPFRWGESSRGRGGTDETEESS